MGNRKALRILAVKSPEIDIVFLFDCPACEAPQRMSHEPVDDGKTVRVVHRCTECHDDLTFVLTDREIDFEDATITG